MHALYRVHVSHRELRAEGDVNKRAAHRKQGAAVAVAVIADEDETTHNSAMEI